MARGSTYALNISWVVQTMDYFIVISSSAYQAIYKKQVQSRFTTYFSELLLKEIYGNYLEKNMYTNLLQLDLMSKF